MGLKTGSRHVSIDSAHIVVDGGKWIYHGREEGPGHYRLKGRERGVLAGTATLHRFEGASILVGDWNVDKYAGMWRIRLGCS